MYGFIIKSLMRFGAVSIMTERVVESALNYIQVEFMDKSGKFFYLEVFYNETNVFSKDLVYIGEGKDYSLSDKLASCITPIGNINDFNKHVPKMFTKKELNEYLSEKIGDISSQLVGIKAGNYKIHGVTFYTNPTLMMFVYLTRKGRIIEPLRVLLGKRFTYDFDYGDHELLINRIKEVLNYE